MKNALLLLIFISSISVQAFGAFIYAPILNPMPDIVIGDADEFGFWTTDVNLFRFPDAFLFDDYVANDEQTTPSLLRWCFVEDWGALNALEINDRLSVDPISEDPSNPPAGKELRSVDPWASFWDIYASPHSYDAIVQSGLGVYPGNPKCDQFVTFWVSESQQHKADSDTIYVKSIDGVIDKLSNNPPFIHVDTFDTGPEHWTFATVTGFSLPGSQSGSGTIGLQGPPAGNVFGFWQTPSDFTPYEGGQLFRARCSLSRAAFLTNADAMPTIRLRWTTKNFSGSAAYYINSIAPFNTVPPITPATKEYCSYFYPPTDTGGLGVAFDMLDFSPDESGLVLLDQVAYEKTERDILGTAVLVKTFDSDFDTWEFSANFAGAFGAISTAGSSADRIALTSTVADAANAGFAQTPPNSLTYDLAQPHLYRATFYVSRGGANAMTFPSVRLRALNEDNQISEEHNINHGNFPGLGSPPQDPANKAFEVYWETPDLPASPTSSQDGFRLAFDLLDFSDAEGDTAYLDRVDVEYFPIPPPPDP
jgi:hypothetical protein